MSLEARSGPKILLKLLLEKSTEVLTQSKVNEASINLLEDELKRNTEKLILLIKQLELITGEELGDSN